jgi:hypothetical protein
MDIVERCFAITVVTSFVVLIAAGILLGVLT